MVLKLVSCRSYTRLEFESDVISDGTQTFDLQRAFGYLFESDVISDGTQTLKKCIKYILMFESDVISDGTQTRQ